jgi:hypothetical protein
VRRLRKRNAYGILLRNLKIRYHLQELDVVGEVILQSILIKWIKKETANRMIDWVSDTKLVRAETVQGTETCDFYI